MSLPLLLNLHHDATRHIHTNLEMSPTNAKEKAKPALKVQEKKSIRSGMIVRTTTARIPP